MKCPECDFEQPDDTLYCVKCDLNFEAWRELNPDAGKPTPAPEPEAAPPVKEEKPAPGMDSTHPGTDQNVRSPQATPGEPPNPAEPKGKLPPSFPKKEPRSAKELKPQYEPDSEPPDAAVAKKASSWTIFHSIGLGLVLLIVTNAAFCVHRRHRAAATAEETPVPVAASVPQPSPSPTVEPPTPTPVPEVKTVPVKAHAVKRAPTPTEEPTEPPAKPLSDQGESNGSAEVPKEISESPSSENVLLVPTEEPTPTPIPEPTDLLESDTPAKAPTSQPTP